MIVLSIAALALSPCLIATVKVSSNFGALSERFYKERIWLQVLKTIREENKEVWELLRVRRVAQNACIKASGARSQLWLGLGLGLGLRLEEFFLRLIGTSFE